MSDVNSAEEGTRPRSCLLFFDQLPEIAKCDECEVLVPLPNFVYGSKKGSSKIGFFKRKKKDQPLHSFGLCTILLLEYTSNEEFVNFAEADNQKTTLNLNLNRIIDKSLDYIPSAKDCKTWQTFHLNDHGKKRSFILKFQKGQQFEEFNRKLQDVVKDLKSYQEGISTDKKYYLVGYKQEEPQDNLLDVIDLQPGLANRNSTSSFGSESQQSVSSVCSDSSEYSFREQTEVNCLAAPFSPKPYVPLNRVAGLEEVLYRTQSEKVIAKEKPANERYYSAIFGHFQKPPSTSSVLNSLDRPDDINFESTLKAQISTREIIYSREDSTSNSWEILPSLNITQIDNFEETCDIRKLRWDKIADFEQTVNITEIDKTLTSINSNFIQSVINGNNKVDIDTQITQDCLTNEVKTDFESTLKDECTLKERSEFADLTDTLEEETDLTMKAQQQFKQYAQLLQAAINDGDQENARQYAEALAANHVKVTVTVDENSLKENSTDQDIKIKVCVEDKETTGGSIWLPVKTTDTIGDLKAKMYLKHNFPVQVQKWIVGKRIPKDEEQLQKLKVMNGQTVYLYLVSAKSVGLDRQQYMAASAGYMDITDQPQVIPTIPQPVMQQLNELSRPSRSQGKTEKPQQKPVVDTVRIEPQTALPAQTYNPDLVLPAVRQEPDGGKERPSSKSDADKNQIGWHCNACTYLNLPTRPGCEMCSHPRPKDYKIPENYVMSKEEIERLQREEEDDRKAQRAAEERRARERKADENIYHKMTEEEIHQLLTLNDQMQQQIRSRQTEGQEHESNEAVQIPRGAVQQENLENIQFTLQPGQHLDFNDENDDSD